MKRIVRLRVESFVFGFALTLRGGVFDCSCDGRCYCFAECGSEWRQIALSKGGHEPAVILLHGYTQTSRMWRPIMPLLAEKFTVIAPDLPGIGDSEIPKSGLDMKSAAISIHGLVKSLGIERARVVGHDIGLMVAYAYAAQFPAETEKLAVMDAFFQASRDGKMFTTTQGFGISGLMGRRRKRWCAAASGRISITFGMILPLTKITRCRTRTARPMWRRTRALAECMRVGSILFRSSKRLRISQSSRRRS